MANETHTLKIGNTSYTLAPLWGNIQSKPTTFPPESHTHNYLSTSGGTVSGTITLNATPGITVCRSSGIPYIRFGASSSSVYGEFGADSTGAPVWWTDVTNAPGKGAWRTIITESNISSWALPKSGGTLTGTLTAQAIAARSGSTYDIGTSGTRFRYGYFSSAVYAASGFYEQSDERLKNFGDKIPIDLEKISKLKKNYFKWKEDCNTNTQIGVSAQEIKEIYPELVTETEDGHLNVAYDKLSVVALGAVDELHKKNKELEERIQKLESIVNELIK